MNISGKTAIVTGSTGQLGSAIARGLAKQGCNCICHYLNNESAAQELVAEIIGYGVKALAVKADLTIVSDIESLFEGTSKLGKANILINSSSIFQRIPLSEMDSFQIEQCMKLNFAAPMLLCKEFVKYLAKDPHETRCAAKIINISDVASNLNWANYSLYCASKAALDSMTRSLAKELSPAITINAVAPGIVSWPDDFQDQDKLYQLDKIPAGRKADFEEIYQAVAFLLENDYITGQILNVDGGRSI